MKTYISLLRGINVSGQKKMRMHDLRRLYESLGLLQVRTYIQSGNVIFAAEEQDTSILTGRIEAQIESTFAYHVTVFMWESAGFQRILDRNPFLQPLKEVPNRLYVTFLCRSPSAESLSSLTMPPGTAEEFVVDGQEIFLYCPHGYGGSKLSNNFFEHKLKMPATTRNWKTVQTLAQMASGS